MVAIFKWNPPLTTRVGKTSPPRSCRPCLPLRTCQRRPLLTSISTSALLMPMPSSTTPLTMLLSLQVQLLTDLCPSVSICVYLWVALNCYGPGRRHRPGPTPAPVPSPRRRAKLKTQDSRLSTHPLGSRPTAPPHFSCPWATQTAKCPQSGQKALWSYPQACCKRGTSAGLPCAWLPRSTYLPPQTPPMSAKTDIRSP